MENAPIKLLSAPKIVVKYKQDDEKGAERLCLIRYNASYFEKDEAERLYLELRGYMDDGKNDRGVMYGVQWESGRKTIQISDPGVRVYKYTGSSATETKPFSEYPAIEFIRNKLYEECGYYFNFCLYNAYPLNSDLGWHSDNEKDMVVRDPKLPLHKRGTTIGSLSFGYERRFRVRKIGTHESVFDETLESGSLLVMDNETQNLTQHCIWKLTEKQMGEILKMHSEEDTIRINLTFRVMKNKEE